MQLQTLTHRLDTFLEIDRVKDYCPNGLQVECARKNIGRIALAVTASLEVIEHAAALGAEALVVHHGYFWKGEAPEIIALKYRRIHALMRHDLALFAYHLPLDIHPVLGNNAMLGKILGIQFDRHIDVEGLPLLSLGRIAAPQSLRQFAQHCAAVFNRQPLVIDAGNKPIQTVAWCTGAAQDFIEQAKRAGADLYLSGEVAERTYYQARELGIHYLACGHHATERYGIQALGEWIEANFGIQTEFIDSDNPV